MRLTELRAVVLGLAPAIRDYVATTQRALHDRITAVEAREPLPGPPGPAGTDGRHGKDGLDGVGFDDFSVVHDGERGFTFVFTRGEQVKRFPFSVPALIYRGVFVDGSAYAKGDSVTWGGSSWYCHAASTTTKPGDGSKDWQVMVKRGAEGKPGQKGEAGPQGQKGLDGKPGRDR